MRQSKSDFDNYREYIIVLDEAHFLFGHDVRDFIEEDARNTKHTGICDVDAPGWLRRAHDGRRASGHVRMSHECMRRIADFWRHLDKPMIPYMLMEQKRPWSVGRVTGYIGHKARSVRKALKKRRSKRNKAKAAVA